MSLIGVEDNLARTHEANERERASELQIKEEDKVKRERERKERKYRVLGQRERLSPRPGHQVGTNARNFRALYESFHSLHSLLCFTKTKISYYC